jgi:anti-sigma-K factor RskA
MDSKAYIESGILETYALGMCSEAEAREVEAMCAKHPELKQELTQIEESLFNYALAHSKSPKAETRAKVLNEINKLQQAENNPKQIHLFYNNRLAIAATLIVFSLSLLGNIFFYAKWKSANQDVIALLSEKQQLAESLNTNKVKYETMKQDMAILTNPDVVKIAMKGVAKSPESLAMIYWNKKSKEVFIELTALPTPQDGKQYQLWAIVDGKPVDAGMISLSGEDTALHRMKDFESAQAFAITLEQEGGSPTPTLTEMYVMGAVGG